MASVQKFIKMFTSPQDWATTITSDWSLRPALPLWPDPTSRPESPPTTSLFYRFGVDLTSVSSSHRLRRLLLHAYATFWSHGTASSPNAASRASPCLLTGQPLARNNLSPSMSSPCLFLFSLLRRITFSGKINSLGEADPLGPQSLASALLSRMAEVILNGCFLLDSVNASFWLNTGPVNQSFSHHLAKCQAHRRDVMVIELTWIVADPILETHFIRDLNISSNKTLSTKLHLRIMQTTTKSRWGTVTPNSLLLEEGGMRRMSFCDFHSLWYTSCTTALAS